MSRTFLVVGGGPAGIEAAGAIRARDPEARIAVVTEEPWTYYSRIRLGEVVDGRTPPEKLALRPEGWWADQRIEHRRGVVVEGLDLAAGRARLSGGEALPWDALLLATGARSFVPPLPGADHPAVRTLRTMGNALEIRDGCREGAPAVVVGGGLLGLELAASLASRGMEPVVVEMAPWLLSRQVDRRGGQVLQRILERKGLRFRLQAGVAGIEAAGADAGALVRLADGEALPGAMVIVAAGVRPETRLAREAGLAVGKGITVDDRLAASAPGVWAAGDCAEHRTGLYGFWSAAADQGRAAGAAMVGAEVAYGGTSRQATLKVSDVNLFAAGDPGATGQVTEVEEGDAYRRLVQDEDGRLVAAVLIGDLKERRAVSAAVAGRLPYPPAA